MVSTNTSNGMAKQVVSSPANRQIIRQLVVDQLKANFANTLGQAPDIVNVVMAMIYRESSFVSKRGISYSDDALKKLLKLSAISSKYNSGTALEKTNIVNANAAFGLGQVTGWYVIKGAGPSGKSEMERLRPDITSDCLVNPGESVETILLGDDTYEKQIKCALVVLEGKYKELAPGLVKTGTYSNKLTAAVAAYLGLGASDKPGTTPEAYANSIIRGEAYKIANNGQGPTGLPVTESSGQAVANNASPTGPAQTIASGNNLSIAGC
jgi:hypothetical protein